MKKILFLAMLITLGSFHYLSAQDTLYLKNGDKKIAKMLKITTQEVTYKDFSNPEGPEYVTEKDKVQSIHYQNGTVDLFEEKHVEYVNDMPVKPKEKTTYNENPITLNSFKTYSEKYNYYKNAPYMYESGDKLNPWVSSLASYFIPGLGQIISGETGRGLAFMAGVYGIQILSVVSMFGMVTNDINNYGYGSSSISNSDRSLYTTLFIGGMLASAGIHVWNIVDAYYVAKINNLYYRDIRKNRVQIDVSPAIMPSGDFASNSYAFGAKLSIHL